jgi:uncharacterized protein
MKQQDGGWSPYLAGALSGVVGVLSVWFAGQFLGLPPPSYAPPA